MRLLTKAQEKSLSKHWARQHHKDFIRSFQTQEEEETMNDNPNTTTEFKPVPTKLPVDADGEFFKLVATKADMVEAHKIMDDFEKLNDEQFEKLLEGKPLDGEITYDDAVIFVTDIDETADEPAPTLH